MNKNHNSILVVDDDPSVLKALKAILKEDYIVLTATSGPESIQITESNSEIATVVMDIKMQDMDGLAAARKIRELRSDIPIIFHTGYPGDYIEDEIEKSEKPFDFITKGKSVTRLLRSVRNAVEAYRSRHDLKELSIRAETSFGMVGRSAGMLEVFRLISKVASSDNKIMILGETGTGKELIARAIHSLSDREPLAVLNCNHKDPNLIESELFGHFKGSFSNVQDRTGLVEYANGGTLFLDEIGDLDITTQAKLLKVIEYGEYQKLGSPENLKTDIRTICATHRNLGEMVSDGRFREDLYYRLKGVVINVPPLRDRKEDIPHLINRFKDNFTIEKGYPPKYFDQSAIEQMMDYEWPGNVRQLHDVVESVIVLTDSELIIADDVLRHLEETQVISDASGKKLAIRLKAFERTCILEALVEANYNIASAAGLLGVERSNLHKKIKALNIDIDLLKCKK